MLGCWIYIEGDMPTRVPTSIRSEKQRNQGLKQSFCLEQLIRRIELGISRHEIIFKAMRLVNISNRMGKQRRKEKAEP